MQIPENSALLLVDVQDSKNPPEIYKSDDQRKSRDFYHENVKKVTEYFREKGNVPIIHVIELHRDDLVDFGRELDGSENIHCLEKDSFFWEPTAPIDGEYVIQKRRYSAFFGTDLEILLRGLQTEHLFICGGMTDICVHYTAVEAHQMDYHIHVVREACGTHSSVEDAEAVFDSINYFQSNSVISVRDLD
ncbi:cysteine hydrolase family protein [Spirochaeta cellobiosiphila]|uniref:cysteine hydrolase family protein n=1 Tax=Spirochaeta cellobiosiphila TaxID=504483 RepID=UPI000401278F|nr:isochorismatase family cysteine hydrolase [Spirochaeta cellobiosiphila]